MRVIAPRPTFSITIPAARLPRRDTDFNIREALKQNRQALLGAQETGKAALAGYEELAPQYNQAVERARNYQGTLTRDYNRYVQDRNQAVDTYNRQLQQRYQTYQNVTAQGAGLERSYKAAQQELNRLSGIKDSAAQQANKLYGTYSSQYSAATKTGQQQYQSQLGGYQSEISNLQKNIQTYQGELGTFTQNISDRQRYIRNISKLPNFYKVYTNLAGRSFAVQPESAMSSSQTTPKFYNIREISSTGELKLGSEYRRSYYESSIYNDILRNYQNKGQSVTDYTYSRYQAGDFDYDRYRSVVGKTQGLLDLSSKHADAIQGYLADIENKNRQIELASGAITRADKNYQDLLKDTGYVTRYAQQQSAGALQNYQRYLQNTYNPSVNTYNQYASGTYNPAAQAYQNFMGSGQVQQALQNYQSLAQDTGFVDRAASDTKAVYDASQQEYSRLQAAYEGMAPQLNEYSQQAETAKQQVLTLAGQAPGLQRSLAIDTEARKRGDRLGYRRSILSQGYKRRGAAR